MIIKKDKKKHNSFSIEGLTAGKLMAINSALEEQKKNGTISPVGEDVLVVINNERKNWIHG
jgi:hypothetical protein